MNYITIYNPNKPNKKDFKICLTCNKPYNWRKKWIRDWHNVKYCSEKCRRNKQ